MIGKKASGFFAEPANLVPACRPCNESRGNKPWEPWLRLKHALEGEEVIEGRVAVMRRFEHWRKPECLDPRKSGAAERWAEYDRIQSEIHTLLRRARTIADELRAAVTADHAERRNVSCHDFPSISAAAKAPTGQGRKMKQRDMMRILVAKHGRNEDVVCTEYAMAEERGDVERRRNEHRVTGGDYAHALWGDGITKGWL